MGFWSRFAPSARVTGYPTSANGASSLHLHWQLPAGVGPVVAAGVQLLVESAPEVDELYFWALQASFRDRGGRHQGGAHLGLQWNPRHPGARAANWGGYAPSGRVLSGSDSPLPSTPSDVNTRDLWWEPGRPVALRITRARDGGWDGSVDGVRIRTLHTGGEVLTDLMVWSEVFARCDDPPVAVRWSSFHVETEDGEVVAPEAVLVNYQHRTAGGCDNTTVVPDPDGPAVRQVTGVERQVPTGARLSLT